MGHIYKFLGSKDQAKQYYENREALEKYLARLKELMGEDSESGPETNEPKTDNDNTTSAAPVS